MFEFKIGTAWSLNPHEIAPLRTGGFNQTTFAGILLDRSREQHGCALLTEAVVDPAFAGYCLDAPEFLPAGGQRSVFTGRKLKSQPIVWQR